MHVLEPRSSSRRERNEMANGEERERKKRVDEVRNETKRGDRVDKEKVGRDAPWKKGKASRGPRVERTPRADTFNPLT